MADQYFRVILTGDHEEKDARSIHEQKLNNYLKYGEPFTNKEISATMLPITYKKVIKHHGVSTAVKNNAFYITTELCCEDEYDNDDK